MSKKNQQKTAQEQAKEPAQASTQEAQTTDRERARNDDGTYMGDDPNTPDVNEAYTQSPDGTAEQQNPEGEQGADQATQDPDTVEAAEKKNPEGVVSTEQADPSEATYTVVWHIKHYGRRYEPGEDVTGLTAEAAARMLRSGSIQPKV